MAEHSGGVRTVHAAADVPGQPADPIRSREGVLDGLARWMDRDVPAIAAILLLAAVAFSPWWLGGRILAPLDILHEAYAPWNAGNEAIQVHNHFTSDAVTQYIVYRRIAERSFAADGAIGWSELTGGGRPEYANTMALYGDPAMQLHRVLDFWTAWHIGLLLQLLVAALGMFALLRTERLRPLVALAGAVAYAASTPLVFTLYHRWQLAAFAWVPWLLWALLRWRRGSALHWPLVAVFIGLALAGGSLQTAVFVLLVLVAMWAGWTWEARREPGAWRLTLHFAAWGVLGAGLAAFTLLPSLLSYLDAVDLHGGRSSPGYAHGALQPVLAILFAPLQAFPTLLGGPASLDLTKLFRADYAHIAFFGLVPVLIAFRCVVWRETPAAVRLLMLAGLVVPLTPLVGALYHRVQIVFVVGGIWAFARYWQHAGEPGRGGWRRLLIGTGVVAGAWLGGSLVLWLAEARLVAVVESRVGALLGAGQGGQLAGFRDWNIARAGTIVSDLRIWHPVQLAMVAGAALGLVALRLRMQRRLQAATLILCTALVLELGTLALRWHTAVDPDAHPPYPVTADLAAVQQLTQGGRVHIAASHDGPAPFLPPNTLAMYDVATIDSYETVHVHGMWEATGQATDAAVLGRLGVTHAVAPAGVTLGDGWTRVHAGSRLDVWANASAVPHYLAVAGNGLEAALAGAAGVAAGGVDVLEATPNRRRLVVAPGATAVRVAENWSEGWEYREGNGDWKPALRAVDRSMLLTLDGSAGRALEMRYRPARRRAGYALTGLAAVLTGLAALGAGLSVRALTTPAAARATTSG